MTIKNTHTFAHTEEARMILSWDDTSKEHALALVLHNSLSQL